MRDSGAAAAGELTRHWRAIVAGFVMAFFAWGAIFYAHGVFKAALETTRGWSGVMLANAQAWFWFVGALAAFLAGAAIDRWGPRAVACYGAYATAAGVLAVGLAEAPWQLFAAYALLATAYPPIGNLGISAAFASLFEAKYATALSYALTGASVGGAVVTPVYIHLIGVVGFAWASGVVAAATLLCLVPVLRWTPARPPARSVADDARGMEAFRAARRTASFWALWLVGFLSFTGQVGFLFHEISIFTPRMGLTNAGYAVSVTVLSAAVGRFVLGWAATRMPLKVVAAATYLIQATGLALAATDTSVTGSFLAAGIAGFCVGPVVMLPAMLMRGGFGADGFGKIFGLASAGMFAGMTVGPGLAGQIADRLGYDQAIWMFAACQISAATVILAAFRPKPLTRRSP